MLSLCAVTARADGLEAAVSGHAEQALPAIAPADPGVAAAPDGTHLDEYVLRLLDECRDEVKLADSKANMLFAAVATVMAILIGLLLDDESQLRNSGDGVVILTVLTLATFVVAIVLLALAVTPRLGQPVRGRARYFQEHAEFTDVGALLHELRADAIEPSQRHASQLLALARIVRRKYQHVRSAMQVISGAMVVLAICAIVAALR
jgi:hypothetical protein